MRLALNDSTWSNPIGRDLRSWAVVMSHKDIVTNGEVARLDASLGVMAFNGLLTLDTKSLSDFLVHLIKRSLIFIKFENQAFNNSIFHLSLLNSELSQSQVEWATVFHSCMTVIGVRLPKRRDGELLMILYIAGTVFVQSASGILNSLQRALITRRVCLQTDSTVPFDQGTYTVENRCLAPITVASSSINSFLKCVPCSENQLRTGTNVVKYSMSTSAVVSASA